MENKLLIISHIGDNDGVTPIILANLTFKNFDKKLIEVKEVDETVKENLDKYDKIYILDLNVSDEMAEIINQNETFKNKIIILDHHASTLHLNKYDFITVISESKDRKESATSLFYDYLIENYPNDLLKKESTRTLVEYVRLIDTYDFKSEEDRKNAENIRTLFELFGVENYIEYFTNYIKNHETFTYGPQEQMLIKIKEDEIKRYLEEKEKEMIIGTLDGYKVAVVYAENYRSQLGNYLIDNHPELDFSVVINVSKKISYRGHGKVDLTVFSNKYGGGGHKDASGSPLPKDFTKTLTKILFKNFKEEKKWNQNFI